MSRRVGFDGAAQIPRQGRSIWAAHLGVDEEILWEGRPGFGISLNGSTIKALAFLAIGFGILGPQVLAMGQMGDYFYVPGFGHISGIWFLALAGGWVVLWGLAQTVQTPFYTHYMLSDHRAYIAKTFLWKRVKSFEMSPFTTIEYDGKPNGSLVFAQETKRAENGKKRSFPVGFMNIAGAGKVYQMMVDIQRRKAR